MAKKAKGTWPGSALVWPHLESSRKTLRCWRVSRERKDLGMGLENQERLRELRGLSLEKRGLSRDFLDLHNSLTGRESLLPENK